MQSSLRRIEFLSSSANRVEILRALQASPHDARDLVAGTDASRSTVGRVLSEFENRGWVERCDDGYQTTRLGALVVQEFEPLLETMDRVGVLEEAVQWLPTDEMSLDLYELGDGDLIAPTENNLSAHVEHGLDVVREGERLLAVGNAMIPMYMKVIRDRTVDGGMTTAQVYGRDVIEMIFDHDHMAGQIEEIMREGDPVYRYPGTVSYNVLVVDDTVLFFLCDETDLPTALLETDNEEVLTWAESAFESYRSEAELLEPGVTI